MATVSRGTNDDVVEKAKPVFVDPFGSDIEAGEVRKLNADANPDDVWGSGAPPVKGFYKLRLMPLAKDSTQKKQSKNDATSFYYTVNCEFQVVSDDKEVDGATVYGSVVTYINRGKELSTMAALIKKLGFDPLPKGKEEISDGALVQRLGKVSQKMPVTKDEVMINWQGSYKTKDGSYDNVFTDYDQFPDDGKGGKLHEVTIVTPEGNKSITARANIQWQVKKGEVSTSAKPVSAKTSAPVASSKNVVVDDLDNL